MINKIKNLLYGTVNRSLLNLNILLCVGMFFTGLTLGFTMSPVAFVLCFVPFGMLFMVHLAFMPRRFDTWKMLPEGLKVSNKILRAMYWAESDAELDKLITDYVNKYK